MSRTDGPWRYGRTLAHGLAVFGTPRVGAPEPIVAVCEDNVANAQLIAQAPELLRILKEMVETFKISDQFQGYRTILLDDVIVNEWKAEIKKAEGVYE